MKFSLYPKLAFDGIRKNKRLYIPYILTCVGMIMMYYIIAFMCNNEAFESLPMGKRTIEMTMTLGGWVIAIFALIFLFYTNSFLIRRRKKEFGLYNILGMKKANLGIIMLWETIIIAAISLVMGLSLGILFSKLAELGLLKILQADVGFSLSISFQSILITVALFSVIFLLLYLNSMRQITFSSAISLMRSENSGEKAPKANYILGILGVLILGGAYYIAVTVQNPLVAMLLFFVAVIMVIIATYMLMISGSVMLCRLLQKNKRYYYKSNHFVSVSSMVFRMKRNGAGLASICILSTMVLVMISSTTCLYAGIDNTLKVRYPGEICFSMNLRNIENLSDETIPDIKSAVQEISKASGSELVNEREYRLANTAGYFNPDTGDLSFDNYIDYSGLSKNACSVVIVPVDDYNAFTGSNASLSDGEVLVATTRTACNSDTVCLAKRLTYKVKDRVDNCFNIGDVATMSVPVVTIIVPSLEDVLTDLDSCIGSVESNIFNKFWNYSFDTGLDSAGQEKVCEALRLFCSQKAYDLSQGTAEDFNYRYMSAVSRAESKSDFVDIYGGLFFLGILLSAVFIMAAVLIIYYKQISEGYEDQARFDIMQKVGMTKREIKKSINSQLLTVFFLPLLFAGCHLAFAFPIVQKMLAVMSFNSVSLFLIVNLICFAIFALLYLIVYKLTSNAYYKIVSGAKE